MPENEVEERVHNFFAPDNFSQSQHHSQVADVKWPVLSNNPWVGNQRVVDVHGSSLRNDDTRQSGTDFERGCGSRSRQAPYDFNSGHTTLIPGLADNRFLNKQPNFNGHVYGHQALQTRPMEANVSGMDAECDQNNLRVQEVSIYEPLQGSASEHCTTRVGLVSSEAPVGFNLFGAQHQMNVEHSGNLQSLMQQQSGYGDMQALHQQATIRKMQELQRQKELFQLGGRQQNSSNCPPFTGQASGNHSHALINGTLSSEAPNSPWGTQNSAGNTNRLQLGATSSRGFSSGLMFSPDKGQESYPEGLVHQQVEQSLYGAPISSSRSSTNQYPRVTKDKSPQGMTYCSNFFHGKQDGAHPEQVNTQNLSSIGTQGFQCKNVFDHTSAQGLRSGYQIENPLQQNSLQRNATVQEFIENQEVVGPSKILKEERDAHSASLHNSVTLDPTEEKILFGSDDSSIWDAFNGSIDTNVGSSNFVKSAGFMDGFPSVQSGSWSALMQSAVAETSSSNVCLKEEQTGFGFQNHHFPAGKSQPSMTYDSGKHKATCDDNKLPINPTLGYDYVPSSGHGDLKNSHDYSVQGFKQFTRNVWQERGARMLVDSSNRQIHPSPAVGSDRPNCGNHTCENNTPSVDVDKNEKINIPSYQTPQQSGYRQRLDKRNNWSPTASLSLGANACFNVYKNENSVYGSQKYNPSQTIHDKSNDGAPAAKLEQQMLSLANPQVTREGSALQDLNNKSLTNEEASLFVSNNPHTKSWKHVDSSVKLKESNSGEKLKNPFAKRPQLVESSSHRSEKEKTKICEMDSYNMENLNDCHRSNLSHNTAVALRTTGSSDTTVKQSLTDGKEKSTNQVDQRTSASRKFQYHPMGNIGEDVEPSYLDYSWAMPLHNCKGLKDQGVSKLFNQVPKGSVEANKVEFPDNEGDDKRFDEVTVKGVLPGHGHIMSTSINSSVGMITSNKASHSSQNMLELLDKVDKLEEHHSWMHFSSTECNQLSEAADTENSDGSCCHLQQCQSPASQGYGLKLAPPSQQLPVSNHISPSPSQTVDSSASTQATFIKGDKGLIKLASNTSGQSFNPSYEICPAELQNNRTVIDGQTAFETSLDKNLENFSSAANFGFSFPSSQFQNQPVAVIKEPESVSRLIDVPYNKHVPKQGNDYYRTFIGDSAAASPPNAAGSVLYDGAGISQEGTIPNIVKSTWIDVPKQQPLLGAEAQPDQVKKFQFQDTVMVESTSTRWSIDRQEINMRNSLSELDAGYVHLQGLVCGEEQQGLSGNTDLVQKMNESQRRGPIIQDLSDAFPSNPASTKTDIEAFGCSLKPNNFFEHNDSPMNQMRIMKNLEPVLEHSVELRPKTSNPNNRLPEQVVSKLEQLGNKSNDMVENVLMHTLNSTVQSDTADTRVIGNNLQCSISSTQSIEHLSAPESLPTDNVGQKFTFSRPKKRKTAASELQSFHNEALQGYLNPQTISMAETNWAKATKRPCEKVGDNAHTIEDGPPMPRARKRLILTTQLMQQLFHAPPAQILSADANLNYETVDYIAARLALADACNLVSRLKSYSDAVPVGTNFQADKCKTSDGVRNQHLSRVMEDFMSRARKVENEILRLEKRSSVLNLRLEGQDIEKIYVVNRIANIYVRGQAQVAETSSSNAALNAQKPFQEKHVATVPFPSNLPDKVPCLSL